MNVDLKNEFKLTNDGDNWGNVMQWLFAIADYLTFETDEYVFQALKEMALPNDEVLQFGKVLIRARDILESKGESY